MKTNNKDSATARPWKSSGGIIFGADGKNLADVFSCGSFNRDTSEQNANAALIVKAANSHADLLQALRDILFETDGRNASRIGQDRAYAIARAAISKATQ